MPAVSETYLTDEPDDGEAAIRRERAEIERTETANADFAAKMAEWRRTGGIPGYVGPRATRY